MTTLEIYALSSKNTSAISAQLSRITPGFTFQGSVSKATDLPATATNGDLYIVKDEGNTQYVYDGTEWLLLYRVTINGN